MGRAETEKREGSGEGEAGAPSRHKAKAFCPCPSICPPPHSPETNPHLPGEIRVNYTLIGTAPRTGPS